MPVRMSKKVYKDMVRPRSGGLVNDVASGHACDAGWGDVDRSLEAWEDGESWCESRRTSSSWGDDVDLVWAHNIQMSIRASTTWWINVVMSQGSMHHISNRCGSSLISLTCAHGTLSLANREHMWSSISMQTLRSSLRGMTGLCTPINYSTTSSSIYSSYWGGLSPTYVLISTKK